MAEPVLFDAKDRRHWEFRRQDDGSVQIVRYIGFDSGEIELTPQDWAHVVAHVSKSGPTQMAKDVAAEFHNTNFGEFEESASVQGDER